MKIKKFNEINQFDPYGEEDWNNKKDIMIKTHGEDPFGKIIYIAVGVLDEDEAKSKLKKNTGITDEYGKLDFQRVTADDAERTLREKKRRLRTLNNEAEKLEEEITVLEVYTTRKK
jgi:hypothetical protein